MSQSRTVAYWVVDMPGGWGVGCCVEGTLGYRPVPEYGPYKDEARAQATVANLNKRAGVSNARARRIVRSTMPRLGQRPLS